MSLWSQHSHNAIFHWSFQKYSVEILYVIIDWKFEIKHCGILISTCPILLAFILNFLLTQSLLNIYTQYLQASRNQSRIWEFTQCLHRISPSSESLNGIPNSFKILMWVPCLHIPSRLIPTHTNSSFWEPLSNVPRVKLNYFTTMSRIKADKDAQHCFLHFLKL